MSLTSDHVRPDYLEGLNPPQQQAVLTTEGPVLMLAGAGTGKTKALTSRLAHLLSTRLAFPGEILAVTFTNKAAREMQHRVGRLIGGVVEGMQWLGTFHAVAARMLRRHAEHVGLKSNFSILDPDDQIRLAKQVIIAAELDEKRWPGRVLAMHIDSWKNRGWTPETLPAGEAQVFADGKAQELYALYQQRLAMINACDFGDLLLHLITIFTKDHDVLASWQRRFKYILVDEYQDTNTCQYLWLRLLAQRGPGVAANICCVGDDDQSIYGWRGAEVGNILKFEQDFPGAKIIRLEQNYRSTGQILAAASGLIAANQSRLGKTLWTESEEGEPVTVYSVWDGADEARVVGDIIETAQTKQVRLSDIAVLVRATFQTRAFEDRFITLGLPYRIIGGFRFYERSEIRDALAYLRVIQTPEDDLAFERIVNTPKRGLGDKTLQKVHSLARQQRIPLLQAADIITRTDEFPAAARRNLRQLVDNITRWRQESAQETHIELARIVLEESGYVDMLKADKSPEAAGRLENLNELTRAMEEFENLGGFLEHVSLVMDNEANSTDDKITVMTMHAAKGLEFDTVFLAGWEEGIFPSQRSMDENGLAALEEERRLAYVGLTRARRKAWIFHAANRQIYGQWQSSIPSRFIAEIPGAQLQQESTLSSSNSAMWKNAAGYLNPFVDVARGTGRGPGWVRASAQGGFKPGQALLEGRATTIADTKPSIYHEGDRIFHEKFGYGIVQQVDGNKLQIRFDTSGIKSIMDSFVVAA
jgi:DNA helicase II / ATP-dependent DNA helicase PcrA